MGAAAGVGAALELDQRQLVDALGIAGSMASRHHRVSRRRRLDQAPACRAGRRSRGCARRCSARAGFLGPRTVFEGVHGLFNGFAHTTARRLRRARRRLRRALGHRDARVQTLSVRDHDASLHRLRAPARCARHRSRRRQRSSSARSPRAPCIGCGSRSPTSRGRPTAMRRSSRPPIASQPASCAAASGSTPSPTRRCAIPPCSRSPPRSATGSIPTIPIPRNYTGHIRALLRDGDVVEERQPHMRGGAHEPLTRQDIEEKFCLQCAPRRLGCARAPRRRCSCADGFLHGPHRSVCAERGEKWMHDQELAGRVVDRHRRRAQHRPRDRARTGGRRRRRRRQCAHQSRGSGCGRA